jgi:hypothetical protein
VTRFILDEEDEEFQEEEEAHGTRFYAQKPRGGKPTQIGRQKYEESDLRPAHTTKASDRELRSRNRDEAKEQAQSTTKPKPSVETARTRTVKARAKIAGEIQNGINSLWLATAPRRKTMLASRLTRTWKTPREKEVDAQHRALLKEHGINANLAREDFGKYRVANVLDDNDGVWSNDILADEDHSTYSPEHYDQADTDRAVRQTFEVRWRFS